MELILLCISIFLAAASAVLLLRLLCYRKQIKHIKEQLSFIQAEGSNFMLTSAYPVGKTQELINVLNEVVENFRRRQRGLERANQSYRESITSISHDIRTPLTSVKGYVQMQKNADIPQEKRMEYLQIVERRLEELSDILNQLFEYARLEAGEFQLNPQRLNLGNIFAEVISMFYEDFASKGLEPQVEMPGEAMFIQADRHAISRILENLIKNALVHGEGKYRFSLAPRGRYAIITIANETERIEEKDLQHIFERYYTTDQSRNRRTTGLGLAIAREFTEQMGGSIEAFLRDGYFTVEVCFALITA